MSKYTTSIRNIIDNINKSDNTIYTKIDDKINYARSKIFDFDYEIWDNSYKQVLEMKILRYYYMREIGVETVALFKLFLQNKMIEIMPEMIQYQKSILDYDILTNFKTEESTLRDTDSSHESNNESNNNSNTGATTKFNDTPTSMLVEDENYASNITNADSSTVDVNTSNTNDITTTTDEFIRKTFGNSGIPYGDLIQKYRDVIIVIDNMIIQSLEVLFLNLY